MFHDMPRINGVLYLIATSFASDDSDLRILVLRAGELDVAFIRYKDVFLALLVKVSSIYIYEDP